MRRGGCVGRRLAARRARGTAVIARRYLEAVRAGFAARGMLAEYEATTDPPRGLPVRDRLRLDVGGG